MAYSSDITGILSAQLGKFVTSNRHQLAGQAANIAFWLDEVRHCLTVIDGYPARFQRLQTAQEAHVTAHATVEFRRSLDLKSPDLDDEDLQRPKKLQPVNDKQLRQARQKLCDAAYGFLVRCCNEGFIDEPELRAACNSLAIGVEASDIRPRTN